MVPSLYVGVLKYILCFLFISGISQSLFPQKAPFSAPKQKGPNKRSGTCLEIYNIEILGDPDLSRSEARKLLKAWEGYCLGRKELAKLLEEIRAFYIQKGELTTRVYLAPQKPKKGELKIKIIPGIIGDIRFAPGQGYASEVFMAFPFYRGRRLELDYLEEGIECLNSLPSNRAQLEIQGTEADGKTAIIIQNPRKKIWRTRLNFDTSRTEDIIEESAAFGLELDSPLLLNDYWNFNIEKSKKLSAPENNSSSRSLEFRLPFAYLQASAFFSQFEYKNLIETNVGHFFNSGSTNTRKLSVKAKAFSTRGSTTFLSYARNKRQSENFIGEVLLHTSSRSIDSNIYSISHSSGFKGASLYLELSQHKGEVSKVEAVSEESPLGPPLKFEKTTLSLNYELFLRPRKEKIKWKSSFQGQASKQILFPGEQLNIGSFHSVRGFKEQYLSGDKGFFLRNELHYFLPLFPKGVGEPGIFFAYDLGLISSNSKEEGSTQIGGLSLGMTHKSSYSDLSLVFSQSARRAHLRKEKSLHFSLTLMY